MNRLFVLALLICTAHAADSKHAPLPQKLVTAKTAYIQNDSGEQGFADNVFTQLEEWGRWRVVTSRAEADVVVALDHKNGLKNNFYLRVIDRESGDELWLAKKDVALRIWGQLTRKLMADLRKRLPPDPPGK